MGIAAGALDLAVEWSKSREQFGRPIGMFQSIRESIARMAADVEAARQLAYYAARKLDSGESCTAEASMAKLFCTDTAMDVATDAVQLAGGYGFIEDLPFERHFRDAKALQIYEGTNQVQRLVIARELLA